MIVKCFDVANMVIKTATEQLDNYHVDNELLRSFEVKCKTLDYFSEGHGTNGCNKSFGYDVDVNLETHEIIIGVIFDMCEFQGCDPMYSIMQNANDIKIEGFQDGNDCISVKMTFIFPGVWVKNE